MNGSDTRWQGLVRIIHYRIGAEDADMSWTQMKSTAAIAATLRDTWTAPAPLSLSSDEVADALDSDSLVLVSDVSVEEAVVVAELVAIEVVDEVLRVEEDSVEVVLLDELRLSLALATISRVHSPATSE
jgi:hypothetical protein